MIAGAELAAAAAYRWKCEFNENAELPAFASVLPEADHNEIVGWEAARELGRFSYVSLEDAEAHPRNALRAELTAEFAAAGAAPVVRVSSRGGRASSGSCRWCCWAISSRSTRRSCEAPIRSISPRWTR